MTIQPPSIPPNPFVDLPALAGGDPPIIHAIVDTPKASRHKYKFRASTSRRCAAAAPPERAGFWRKE